MASSLAFVKVVCAIVVCMVVVAPHAEAAITCGLVASKVGPCMSYLSGGARNPSPVCCNGIKTLKGMASSPGDRKTACNCLKSAAKSMKSLNYGKAAGLPRACSVSIPFPISPNTDCSRLN